MNNKQPLKHLSGNLKSNAAQNQYGQVTKTQVFDGYDSEKIKANLDFMSKRSTNILENK